MAVSLTQDAIVCCDGHIACQSILNFNSPATLTSLDSSFGAEGLLN